MVLSAQRKRRRLIYGGKRMGGVCCREQAHVPEHMYVTLFVQALQLRNWNHMGIYREFPSQTATKTWPPTLPEEMFCGRFV